ncbi:hypothetical protein LCGC14_2348890 [marine sediment metagenome]|uniref:FCP1 homology domain-containing protein n=1 Tax=marine sediment metagenome TaxID=412755 RepID=A0A0F8XIX2_9ZZZZ
MILVGYDLDGTLCKKSSIDKKWGYCNKAERRAFNAIREHHYKTAEILRTPLERRYYIITSRSPKYAKITLQWLNKGGLEPVEIFFIDRARTRPNMIEYKSSKINELKLKKYYEDDPKIVKSLTRKCHNTEIILVESVTTDYNIKNFLQPPLQI